MSETNDIKKSADSEVTNSEEKVKSVVDEALSDAISEEQANASATAAPEQDSHDADEAKQEAPAESEESAHDAPEDADVEHDDSASDDSAEAEAPIEEPKREEPAPAVINAPRDDLNIMSLHADKHEEAQEDAPDDDKAKSLRSEYRAPEVPKAPKVSAPPEAPAKKEKKRTGILAAIAIVIALIAIFIAGYDVRLRSQEQNMLKSKAAMESALTMTVSTDVPVISTKNGLIYSDDPNPIIAQIPDQLRPYIGQYPSEGNLYIEGLEALNLQGTHTITFVLSDTDQYGQTVENRYSMMVEVAEGRETLQTAEPSASPEATADASASPGASAETTAESDIPDIGVSDTLGPARNDAPDETIVDVTPGETPTATPDDSETVTIISDGQQSCQDSGGSWNETTGVCSYN